MTTRCAGRLTRAPAYDRPVRLPHPFRPLGEHAAIDLTGGRVVFTTRRGGVSRAPYATLNLGLGTDDAPSTVGANRDRLAAALGVGRERWAHGWQVHGRVVRRVVEPPASGAPRVPGDGQATTLRDVAPVVVTADCLPVGLVADGGVAMLHAGWRGLAAGILAEGVRALRELGVTAPLAAAIGPGAGGCCYQVGDEVRRAFPDVPDAARGRNLDLPAIARRRLAEAGVEEVHDIGLCTLCGDPALFFSHRRDGGVTGRQAGLAWRA